MKTRCPASDQLMEVVLAEHAPDGAVGRHASDCQACRTEMSQLRETVAAVRRLPHSSRAPATGCLDDSEIAELIDGVVAENAQAVGHLASCGTCRARVGNVGRLLRDDLVDSELRKLDMPSRVVARSRRWIPLAAVAALAAGIVSVAVLGPAKTATPVDPGAMDDAVHRERAITLTSAPRILEPAGAASRQDSFVWTSVPHADRYQIKVFDHEGTVVVDQRTSDTTLAIPPRLARPSATTYLWKVEARTGWDRWVVSEWKEFTMQPRSEKP